MKIEEYISKNYPFYHITPMENLESIKQNGLLRSESTTRNGICVVRTSDDDIINEIIDTQLNKIGTLEGTLYALIKLRPLKHKISADVVTADPIKEKNKKLYNYLCMDIHNIDDSDIIRTNMPIGNCGELKVFESIIDIEYLRLPPEKVNES